MNFSLARQNFHAEVEKTEEEIDLAKAALYIAQEEYPELETELYLKILDQMAEAIREILPAEKYPLRIINCINQHLYEELGFRSNSRDYYDPANSFLNQVLERHTGIPITLSLVYLEVAKRLDFPMVGIGMPGHFLIRPQFEEAGIFVDAFNQGEILFPQDCEERLSQVYQQPIKLESHFLRPVDKKQFLARMLTNLKYIYLNQHQLFKALGVVEKILLLVPEAAAEIRDRGILKYQLGQLQQAAADLRAYLEIFPQAEDGEMIRYLLQRLDREEM